MSSLLFQDISFFLLCSPRKPQVFLTLEMRMSDPLSGTHIPWASVKNGAFFSEHATIKHLMKCGSFIHRFSQQRKFIGIKISTSLKISIKWINSNISIIKCLYYGIFEQINLFKYTIIQAFYYGNVWIYSFDRNF